MLYEYEMEEDDLIGEEPKEDLELFTNELRDYKDKINETEVIKAFNLCIEWHGKQRRASGKPYYLHPVKVAMILINEMNVYDTATIIAGLLHDTIEDVSGGKGEKNVEREIRKQKILSEFPQQVDYTSNEDRSLGQDILDMVEAVTKIKSEEDTTEGKAKDMAETYRKLFMALVKDARVILIKLADRLHNMRTLHYLPERKQQRIGEETLNFYTPIAHRLGLNKLKMELEDRSLYVTDKQTYEDIRTALADKRRDFIEYIRVFSDNIVKSLNEHNTDHVLTVVHKHVYEIYKMIQAGTPLSEIDNFYSMVITTNSEDKFECYKAHGILVNQYNPVDHLIDYISQPKINFYQSLKTHLFGPDGKLVEVLIRTRSMEDMAEGGIASNFSFNVGRIRALEISDRDLNDWGDWMKDMIEERGEEATQLIWESIRNNLFDSEVAVYTTDGKQIKLPSRACPVDFAFAISDDLGLHCISAKINGKIKELNYELQNGDRVFIISSPNTTPKPEWQNFVISHRAEVALHKYFKAHPVNGDRQKEQKKNFDVTLYIRGEDNPGMLKKITEAIGQTNIKRVSLDSSDADFGGAIFLTAQDYVHLNSLYAKLFEIKGIKSVEMEEDSSQ